MDPNEYQRFTNTTAIYPHEQSNSKVIRAMYCALGLTGEAGEVADKIKKWHRDGEHSALDIIKELGDVCWYIAQLCEVLDIGFADVLDKNVAKLKSRQNRGKISGSGDDR